MSLAIPFWLPLLLTAIPTAWLWHRDRSVFSCLPDHLFCRGCGYDLTGNTSGVCPECGEAKPPPALVQNTGMKPPAALLITLGSPSKKYFRQQNFEENVPLVLDGKVLHGRPAPWNPLFDLIVNRETRNFLGVSYPIDAPGRSFAKYVCEQLDSDAIDYRLHYSVFADNLAGKRGRYLGDHIQPWRPGDPIPSGFPVELIPYRGLIEAVFQGSRPISDLPIEIKNRASMYFDESSRRDYGRLDTVTIVWNSDEEQRGLILPPEWEIKLAQQFAQDIWYYEQPAPNGGEMDLPVAVAINDVAISTSRYELKWPDFPATALD